MGDYDADLRIFPDEFVPNVQASKTYQRWAKSSPGDRGRWEAFRDALLAGQMPTAPSMSTTFGRALVAAGKEHMSISQLVGAVTNPYPPPDPGPPPATVVFSEDFADISNPPWTAMFDYTGTPTITGGSVQGSPSGRLQCVTSPDGVGRALRTEMRDSDPGWPYNPTTDRAHIQASATASFGGYTQAGDIYYFDFELWLPLNNPVGEYFDYPRSQWYRLWEPHESTGTRWSGFTLISDGLPANNAWMPLRVAGGAYPQPAAYYPLFQLTNSDGSWHTENFNRRLHIRYGGRLAPDNSGYVEAWVDGAQVIPRTYHANMWVDDTGWYLTPGQYKAHGDLFPHYGASVVYLMNPRVEVGS